MSNRKKNNNVADLGNNCTSAEQTIILNVGGIKVKKKNCIIKNNLEKFFNLLLIKTMIVFFLYSMKHVSQHLCIILIHF